MASFTRRKHSTTVESCYALDINYMHREGSLQQGAHGMMYWIRTDFFGAEHTASVSTYRTARGIILIYALGDGRPQHLFYHIDIAQLPCNYGGIRPYLICPGHDSARAVTCNRRVTKLYKLPMGQYFFCRQCHSLTYTSCNTSGNALKIARRQTRRVARKLQLRTVPSRPALIERPKGMHKKTFELLKDEFLICYQAEQDALSVRIAAECTRLNKLVAASEAFIRSHLARNADNAGD
jgi:hypothetical protein